MKHHLILQILLATSLLTSFFAYSLEPTFTSVFSDNAIKGYDTVAYFTQGEAVKGNKKYSTDYNGARWLFSSNENLVLFKEDPEKYAPQYGGYCAYAVAQNTTASIKPELFTIVGDKLYLNYSKSINEKWRKDKQQFITAADGNWPSLLAD